MSFLRRQGETLRHREVFYVIPAKAGIHLPKASHYGIPEKPAPVAGRGRNDMSWLSSGLSRLGYLKELKIEVVIPGHGLLCDKSEIEKNLKYLAKVIEHESNDNDRRQK